MKADEDRQQQKISCQQEREPIKGYPQTLSEAVNRAKVIERQVADRLKRQQGKGQYAKRNDRGDEVGDKRGGNFQELNTFAAVNDNPKRKRLSYREIRSLPPDAKASDYGFDDCRHCIELGLDSDHVFYNCKKNPKWKPFSPKKDHKGDQRNLQRNLAATPSKKEEETMSKEEIMAKIEMAYEMGKGAQEANSVANKTEMSNFMRSLSTPNTPDTQDYRRK